MGSPVEGRVLAFEDVSQTPLAPIKGISCDIEKLIRLSKHRHRFSGGPAMIFRLSPADYHRFHLPDDASAVEQFWDGRRLYSVHPFSLATQENVFLWNIRHVQILATKSFGLLAYVSVGAFCVGSIRLAPFPGLRGGELGYFEMGGSTVILVGEVGKWAPDADLIAWSEKGVETLVRLGEPVAKIPTGH